MSRRGGRFEVGNISVGNRGRLLHLVAQKAQTRPQDHGDLGLKPADFPPDVVGALLILFKRILHRVSSQTPAPGRYRHFTPMERKKQEKPPRRVDRDGFPSLAYCWSSKWYLGWAT
ncbi:hypothetical protein SDC9_205878 [bioreactor metagenome]|uniref:Uncharacterized protein n=1 Tax=bioreactor metagenome TaxID=1076179 RepID=A0A645J457_9ZZZZ